MATRPAMQRDRDRSRRRRRTVVGALAIASLLLVGSPARMSALLTAHRSAASPASPASLSATAGVDAGVYSDVGASREPTAERQDNVTGSVTERTGAEARPGADVTQGRWGATPTRPQAPGFLVEELRAGWRVEAGNEEAAALAVIAAHAWAEARRAASGASQGAGSARATGAAGATGAIVAIEAVERPGSHHAVVTALVAPDGPQGDVHRIAVPVQFGESGPSLAGPPWQLPPPDTDRLLAGSAGLTGTPVGDPELIASARRALDAVGLPGDRLVALEATDGWPFIARLDGDAVAHPWLRWHLDRFVVAGLPLTRAGSTRP